jgi:hypothetical protein
MVKKGHVHMTTISAQARNRRYQILQFLLTQKEPVLSSTVASFSKNGARIAQQDLVWLVTNGLVGKQIHRGVIKLPRRHFATYCTWELTDLGRERARQIAAQTAGADVTLA